MPLNDRLRQIYDSRSYLALPIRCLIIFISLVLLNVFIWFAVRYDDSWQKSNWCSGPKLFVVLVLLCYVYVFYYDVIKVLCANFVSRWFQGIHGERILKIVNKLPIWHLLCLCGLSVYILTNAFQTQWSLISFCGIWFLIVFGCIISRHFQKIRWRQILWCLNLQMAISLLMINYSFLLQFWQCIHQLLRNFFAQADVGSSFIFGYLITGKFDSSVDVTIPKQNPIYAFQIYSDLVFFSMVVSILWYYKVITWFVIHIGRICYFTIGLTSVEATAAILSIFFSLPEIGLILKHYVQYFTSADLVTFATLAKSSSSGILYNSFHDENATQLHRIVQCVVNVPSNITMVRLMFPETEPIRTTPDQIEALSDNLHHYNNLGECIIHHMFDVIRLIGSLAATTIVFTAFAYLVDDLVSWLALMLGFEDVTATWLLGNCLSPLMFLVGIEWNECFTVGYFVAVKIIYHMDKALELLSSGKLTPRSEILCYYLLTDGTCIRTVGFNMAVAHSLAPGVLAKATALLTRSFTAAFTSTLLTTCIMGAILPPYISDTLEL